MVAVVFIIVVCALACLQAKPVTHQPASGKNTKQTMIPQYKTGTRQYGCEYEGQLYFPGESFGKVKENDGRCYGFYCTDDGSVIPWTNLDCETPNTLSIITITRSGITPGLSSPKMTSPRTTFPPTRYPTTPLGCLVDGKFYVPGEEISSGIDNQSGLCYGSYCSYDGVEIPFDNFNCFPTTTSNKHSTTKLQTTTPLSTPTDSLSTPLTTNTPTTTDEYTTFPSHLRCEHEGKFYAPGEEISRGTDGDNWCFGLFCSSDGHVTPWDDFDCGITASLPPATTFLFTTPKTTKSSLRTTTRQNKRKQKLITSRVSSPKMTTPGTTYPTTPLGCLVDGKFYEPGEEISSGIDRESGWCYGSYCSYDGVEIPWDNFNCFPTTTPTTIPLFTIPKTSTKRPTSSRATTRANTRKPKRGTPRLTTSKTTTPRNTFPPTTYPTTPLGCLVNGEFYAPGEEISSGIDRESGWCYGSYCGDDGVEIAWDNFNCFPTTTPTTIPPFTTPKTTTKRSTSSRTTTRANTVKPKRSTPRFTTPKTTTPRNTFPPTTYPTTPLGCLVNGEFYAPGEEISSGIDRESGWCYGSYCGDDGVEIAWDNFNCFPTTTPPTTKSQTTAPLPTSTTTKEYTTVSPAIGCEHQGKFYDSGQEISRKTSGRGSCSGLICGYDGNIIPWSDFNCAETDTPLAKSTVLPREHPSSTIVKTAPPPLTTFPEVRKPVGTASQQTTTSKTSSEFLSSIQTSLSSSGSETPTLVGTVLPSTPHTIGWCFFKGQYYENGDIITRVYHGWSWCSGWHCKNGKVASWRDFNCPNPTTLPRSIPTPSAPTTQCYHKGIYYAEGELVRYGDGSGDGSDEGSGICEGLYCSGGVLVPYSGTNCGSTQTSPPTTEKQSQVSKQENRTITDPPVLNTNIVTMTKTPPSSPLRSNTNAPWKTLLNLTPTTTETVASTKPPKPDLCYHEGKFYEEGDLISRDFDGDNWCTGWICKGGRLIYSDCGEVTEKDISSPESVLPPATRRPIPPLCFHEGRYYEEGDLAIGGNNWCSGFICKNGVMQVWENCKVKTESIKPPQSTQLPPIIDTSKTTSTPVQTVPTVAVTEPTFNSIDTTTTASEQVLCFHEGRYYEEGDIISRDFDSDDWCSGWICKRGKLISVNCSDITSVISGEGTSITEPVFPSTTPAPLPPLCTHDGRYYEEGDMALSDNDWCSGLICKDGEMELWDNCEVKLRTTRPLQTTRTPEAHSSSLRPPKDTTKGPDITSKPPESTPSVPQSSTQTPVTMQTSSNVITGTSKINLDTTITPKLTIKSLVPTEKVSDTTPKILEGTTLSTSSISSTTDSPTKPQQTTPTQSPVTIKPEKVKCFYEGKLYPPGEVTRGALGDGRCYGVVCDISGVIIQWQTPTCTPTEPPTAEIRKNLPGCFYRDRYYPPGRISRITDGTNWCLDVICTDEGKITSINNMKCNQPTTTTAPPTTEPVEVKCLYNGRFANFLYLHEKIF